MVVTLRCPEAFSQAPRLRCRFCGERGGVCEGEAPRGTRYLARWYFCEDCGSEWADVTFPDIIASFN
jgi:hypothetical protein